MRLFLKIAKDKGFRTAIGVEKSAEVCKRGKKYRDSIGYDYEILNRAVGENFSFDEIPLADVTLISNVHYYFAIDEC